MYENRRTYFEKLKTENKCCFHSGIHIHALYFLHIHVFAHMFFLLYFMCFPYCVNENDKLEIFFFEIRNLIMLCACAKKHSSSIFQNA